MPDRDKGVLPWYFNKDHYGAPFCQGGMHCDDAHTQQTTYTIYRLTN